MLKLGMLIVAVLLTIAVFSPATEPEYVIPGTVSATCGPTLPQYTYCE